MKISARLLVWFLFAVMLVSGHSCTTYRPIGQESSTVTLQVFYDALSPYGEWVQNRQYGFVWIPHAGSDFFPYETNGNWIYTEYGWTWYSDYTWGWAPFHYGRWDYDPAYGWFWFPGEEWAPAWVTWRMGDGYYGWSPMRPETDFGFNYTNDDINNWVFVRDRDFARRNLNNYIVSNRRNDDIIRRTQVIRNERTDNMRNATYAAGPDPDEVSRAAGKRIRSVTVSDMGTPGRRLNGSRLEIYRPRVETSSSGQRPAPSRISDVKDVRPMRERDRSYRPGQQVENRNIIEQRGTGQGQPEIKSEQVPNSRERDTRRQMEQRQVEMQERQQATREQSEQRQLGNAGQKQNPDREYRQTRSERRMRTDQQKKAMQKERQHDEKAISDSSRSIRQNRRR